MNFDKTLDFLNRGGLLAAAVIVCTYAFIKIDRLETKTDTLQAVVIDCYRERLEDVTMLKASSLLKRSVKTKRELIAIIPHDIYTKRHIQRYVKA